MHNGGTIERVSSRRDCKTLFDATSFPHFKELPIVNKEEHVDDIEGGPRRVTTKLQSQGRNLNKISLQLAISFTQQNSSCISKCTTKHMQKPDLINRTSLD